MRKISHNKYTSVWPIIRRHWQSAYKYLTAKKVFNLALANFERWTGQVKIKSHPYFIKIEPTNICNLACPGCLHGQAGGQGIEKLGRMDLSLFKKIVDEEKDFLVKVSLYSMGEPLLHPDILDMVKTLNEAGVGSVISSNLNFLTPELAQGMVKNKLSHLIVCLDGCNEENYKKYRQGGELGRVKNNLKLIAKEKKKAGSKCPLIEIQTISLEYLKDDIKELEKFAEEIGADIFSLKDDLRKSYENPEPKEKTCFWLYGHPQIKFDGTIQPCCFYYAEKNNDFGNAGAGKLVDILNNGKFQQARNYFKTGKKSGEPLSCHNCIFFKPKV